MRVIPRGQPSIGPPTQAGLTTLSRMSSRKEMKEERRREREEFERTTREQQRARRRRRAAYGVVGVLAAGGGIAALATSGSGGDGGGGGAEAFAAKPDGLQERVAEAKLPLGADHFHPTVKVFIGQEVFDVPVDIGGAGGGMESPAHKHAGNDAIHAEGLEQGKFTLGQFMRLWGVPLTPTQLGPYREEGDKKVRLLVKDKGEKAFTESQEFGDLVLREGQQVYLVYGTLDESPVVE